MVAVKERQVVSRGAVNCAQRIGCSGRGRVPRVPPPDDFSLEDLYDMPAAMPSERGFQKLESSRQVLINHTSVGAVRTNRSVARPSMRRTSLA